MKRLVLPLMLAVGLGGCATSSTAPTATQQIQTSWYVTCKGWQALQPQITAKIPTASVAQVKTVLPLAQAISAQCEAPIPANPQQATVQLTASITTVLVTLGIQQVTK